MADKCSRCGHVKEEYGEDEVGHCIVILSTFINREPSLTAPLLPEILLTMTRVARETQYSWELDQTIYVPNNSRSIAKQFIRCALHQVGSLTQFFPDDFSQSRIGVKKVRFQHNQGLHQLFLTVFWGLLA